MRRIAIVLALVSTLVSLAVDARPSQEPAPVRYLVITAGRTAGEQVVRQIGGGRIEATFEFNDRGRGPKTLSRIDVGDGGVPTRVEVTGNDYYKNTVSETFSVENGIARWKNESEVGEAPAVDRRFYVSLNGPPVEAGLLARALLAAPENRLALMPAGEVRIRTIGPREISADGVKRERPASSDPFAGERLLHPAPHRRIVGTPNDRSGGEGRQVHGPCGENKFDRVRS